jgi:hypothetical protein
VVGDEIEVGEEGLGLALGRVERGGPRPALAEEVLQGQMDLLLVLPALVRVEVERRHQVALCLELSQGLDLGAALEFHAASLGEIGERGIFKRGCPTRRLINTSTIGPPPGFVKPGGEALPGGPESL